MKMDRSVGGCIFRDDRGALEVLLMKRNTLGWGVPKGHPNAGESDLDAAKREVAEETGYVDVAWLDDPWSIRYLFDHFEGDKCFKTVTFYCGVLRSEQTVSVTLDDHEIAMGLSSDWQPVSEAVKAIRFEPMQTALLAGLGRYQLYLSEL